MSKNAPYSNLDENQIIRQVFDEANDRLRVDAVVTATIADVIINAEESNIAIKDSDSGNLLKVNDDGSLDSNVIVDHTGDSIRIGNGTSNDYLKVNPDGSINVIGVTADTGTHRNYYTEQLSVAKNSLTTLITQTVPVNKTFYMIRIEASGTTTAEYSVWVNGSVYAKNRTSALEFNTTFDFYVGAVGIPFVAGTIILVKGIHQSDDPQDFNARLQGLEK